MQYKTKSIRPFIGAKDFERSRNFYRDLGFEETTLGNKMSVFKIEGLAFYLQDFYIKDWIDNSMIFLEVNDVTQYWNQLKAMEITTKYNEVKLIPIKENDWGRECFVHDPSGVLWHIGEFYK